jgi:hypothetical protein
VRLYYNSRKYAQPYWVRLTKNELDMVLMADPQTLLRLKAQLMKVKDQADGK